MCVFRYRSLKFDWYRCFQVGRDEVHKDQVPDLPYLNATTWASHESLRIIHYPTAPNPPSTMTCPAVELQDVARVGAPESDGQCLENPSSDFLLLLAKQTQAHLDLWLNAAKSKKDGKLHFTRHPAKAFRQRLRTNY